MIYGLFVLAFAWAIQFYFVWKKHATSLNPWFLRFSAIGLLILIFETFKGLGDLGSWSGILAFVLVILTLWKLGK